MQGEFKDINNHKSDRGSRMSSNDWQQRDLSIDYITKEQYVWNSKREEASESHVEKLVV